MSIRVTGYDFIVVVVSKRVAYYRGDSPLESHLKASYFTPTRRDSYIGTTRAPLALFEAHPALNG
jgi:hypothetical protein